MGGDGDGVEGDGDDELDEFEGRPESVFEEEGEEELPDGEDEELGLLFALDGDGDAVVFELDGFSAVELDDDGVLQLGDDFLGDALVADVDDQGAADVAGQRLHRHVLDALDLVGDEHGQVVVYCLPVLLEQHLVRKPQLLLRQLQALQVLLKPSPVELLRNLPLLYIIAPIQVLHFPHHALGEGRCVGCQVDDEGRQDEGDEAGHSALIAGLSRLIDEGRRLLDA